jgi:pyruvate formate lyase activating enzyme
MISGYKDLSLIDYPGLIAPVVFVGGCNFRCPFCHNADLVLHPTYSEDYSVDKILAQIKTAKSLADGVVITGGEPTLWPELKYFIRQVRAMDLKIKLDTNGSFPNVLANFIQQKLIDYVAMDIKTSINRYHEAAGVKANTEAVQKSITILSGSNIPHEFRTTCVPTLVTKDDIFSICRMLGKGEKLTLQNFRPDNTLNPAYASIKPYTIDAMNEFLEIATSEGLIAKII